MRFNAIVGIFFFWIVWLVATIIGIPFDITARVMLSLSPFVIGFAIFVAYNEGHLCGQRVSL